MKPQKTIRGYEIAGRMPLFQKWGRDAIREDRKTQTRRVIKTPAETGNFTCGIFDHAGGFLLIEYLKCQEATRYRIKCPWKVGEYRVMTEPLKKVGSVAWYADTEEYVELLPTEELLTWRWKRDTLSAMFMPYEAARTICQITGIRVERVQDITRSDIRSEGLVCPEKYRSDDLEYNYKHWYHHEWMMLWNSINKKRGYGWGQNNRVFVQEFKRV